MTNVSYASFCPDGRKEIFQSDVVDLIFICVHNINSNRNRKAPSKLKSELESLSQHIRGLSKEAKSVLEYGSEAIPVEGVANTLMTHIEEAIADMTKGRTNRDWVRARIGYDGAAIWYGHGGDFGSKSFEEFLEVLIEEINDKVTPAIKADASNLARQVRQSLFDLAPNGWSL